MKIQLILIIPLFILSSCNFFRAPGEDNCEKIISSRKMAAILGDAYIMEAYLSKNMDQKDWLNDSAMYYYGGLFEKHGVSKSDFEQALHCYLLNEKEMSLIHEDILNHLSILQSKAEKHLVEKYSVQGEMGKDTIREFNKVSNRDRWQLITREKTIVPDDSLLFKGSK